MYVNNLDNIEVHSIFLAHCYAIAGPGIGKDCIFPFSDQGKIYRECAKSYPAGMPKWCKTDEKEALSDSIKSYGICHSGCDDVAGNNVTLH